MKQIFFETLGRVENGNLIENIPDINCSLLIDEIGVKKDGNGNVLIDLDSFRTASQKRSGWVGAFSLSSAKPRTVINELAMESETLITINSQNRLRNIPIDNDESSIRLTLADILSDNNGFPDIQIVYSNKVFNSFRIFYRIDYESKDFLKSEYICSDSTSLSTPENSKDNQASYYTNLCLNSLQQYDKGEEYVIKSDYVRDRTTAVNLLKHLTERLTFKKEIITLKTLMNERTLVLEIGDLFEIYLPDRNLAGIKYLVTKIIFNLSQRNMVINCYQID